MSVYYYVNHILFRFVFVDYIQINADCVPVVRACFIGVPICLRNACFRDNKLFSKMNNAR